MGPTNQMLVPGFSKIQTPVGEALPPGARRVVYRDRVSWGNPGRAIRFFCRTQDRFTDGRPSNCGAALTEGPESAL
jgi:hypothetical protein